MRLRCVVAAGKQAGDDVRHRAAGEGFPVERIRVLALGALCWRGSGDLILSSVVGSGGGRGKYLSVLTLTERTGGSVCNVRGVLGV